MNEKLERLLGKKIGDLTKLHGDASYREYYRANLKEGGSVIVMQLPKGKSSVSEEITNFKGTHSELPFINVQKCLLSCGLPVPQILCYSEADRIIVLEDLGDELFIKKVVHADKTAKIRLYKQALDLLVSLQHKTQNAVQDCVAIQRSFDATLLNWEFDHFREYLIEERLGQKMKKEDRALFEKLTRKITDRIIGFPKLFTHRDFQSKNLIVREDGSLFMIDFQDALIGPYVYDLVALLRDSYVELKDEVLEELIKYYAVKKGISDLKTLMSDFDLMTLQRKMKDAGRFIYIDRVKKNPNFLQYLPTTLKYVKEALEKTDKSFLAMLGRYVPEFKIR